MTDLLIQAGYMCDCTTFVVQPVRVFSLFFRRFVHVRVSDVNRRTSHPCLENRSVLAYWSETQ